MKNSTSIPDKCVNSEWLNSWIDTRHLQENLIKTHCRTFAESPVKMLKLDNFLNPEIAVKLSAILENDVKYKTNYGLRSAGKKSYGDEYTTSFDEWNAADESNKFFKFDDFDGFSLSMGLNENIAAYLKFTQAFKDFKFINYLNSITGVKTHPQKTTMNCVAMSQGDYLREHKDDHDKFRLAYVFYLSQNWQRDFGGKLQLLDTSRNKHTVEPEFNTFVIFSVADKTSHYVEPVKSKADNWQRRTMSGWLYEPTE
ncbi:MAG: 2OG-Fe(II) oxygenase family protein [Acidobacteriota bacterium]